MKRVLTAPLRWMRATYDWVLGWAESPHSRMALFFLSLAEASFFPIPPDALLIGLCMGRHKQWKQFALVCSVGSIVGGMIGYLLGYAAFELIGDKLLGFTAWLSGGDPKEMLEIARYWFNEKQMAGMQVGPWAVGIAGFTPIPYKVFTIAAGFFEMNFLIFVVASVISRSARFFVVAGLIGILYEKKGEKVARFIDRWFNLLAMGFVLLLIAGFSVLKLL